MNIERNAIQDGPRGRVPWTRIERKDRGEGWSAAAAQQGQSGLAQTMVPQPKAASPPLIVDSSLGARVRARRTFREIAAFAYARGFRRREAELRTASKSGTPPVLTAEMFRHGLIDPPINVPDTPALALAPWNLAVPEGDLVS